MTEPLPSLPPFATRASLAEALDLQVGVISRRQALIAGESDNDLRRRLRRREWASVHPGVYVTHTGPLTWLQRAWAAVLYAEPAALTHGSALRADDGPGRRGSDEGPIHIAVHRDRVLRAPAGVVIHRLADLDTKVRWNASPPRVRVEHAAIDVAAEATDELSAIATLADAVRSRRTTATRLLEALDSRSRISRRRLLTAVLTDVTDGVCSTLEREYLAAVERAHGLPTGDRQVRESVKGTLYRDVVYTAFGIIVELDGRLFHERTLDRDRDMERDLDAALGHRDTVRLGWGQVHVRPCLTAAKIGRLLQQRGWQGAPRRCPRCREDGGGWLSPDDSQPPPSRRSA